MPIIIIIGPLAHSSRGSDSGPEPFCLSKFVKSWRAKYFSHVKISSC